MNSVIERLYQRVKALLTFGTDYTRNNTDMIVICDRGYAAKTISKFEQYHQTWRYLNWNQRLVSDYVNKPLVF